MIDKTHHLVFLTPGFPYGEKDSTTIPALQEYLKTLRIQFPEVKMTVITFQYPFQKENYLWNGINVIPLNGKNLRMKKIWIWKKAMSFLKKIHNQSLITIIHSFWIGECSLIGQKFSSQYGVKHIVTAMGQDVYKNNRYIKLLSNSNASVITLSKNHQKELFKNSGFHSTIIPWSVDTKKFPDISSNTIDILGVGSLNEIKNYHLFIDIIDTLVREFPNLTTEIIGDGKLRYSLENYIKQKKLTNTIVLTGKLSRKNVLKKMATANVLLHTSSYESFGYVFAEALYSGMQIVSFDVGATIDIPQWHIGNSNEELVSFTTKILSKSTQIKKRVLPWTKEDTILAYTQLYNSRIS
ncbi:glycosyltransferase [Aquimarina sp. MMG016]|uniref:glycosyltransferase n=1 Tax=Aquimarina sp. MMG016 TaxID=2822690 RepID=UPI001B3A6636|nr:glycosyltransferase [Aquimarina sp. MMG016]MBQ4821777.1 glycosyltransferase [Aquimarina sp. MMG016]